MSRKSNTNITDSTLKQKNIDDEMGVLKNEYYDILTTEDCFDFDVANNIVLGYN